MKIVVITGQKNSGKDTLAKLVAEEYTKRTGKEAVFVALADPIKRFAAKVFDWTEKQLWGPSAYREAGDNRYCHKAAWIRASNRLAELGPEFCLYAKQVSPYWTTPDDGDSISEWANLKQTTFDLYMSGDALSRGPLSDGTGLSLSPRQVLLAYGTGWGRSLNEDIWINAALRSINDLEVLNLCSRMNNRRSSDYRPPDDYYTYTPWGGVRKSRKGDVGLVIVTDARFLNELQAFRQTSEARIVRVVDPKKRVSTGHVSETEQLTVDKRLIDFTVFNDKTLGMDKLHVRARELSDSLFGA